jgi:hypothetical protein
MTGGEGGSALEAHFKQASAVGLVSGQPSRQRGRRQQVLPAGQVRARGSGGKVAA